MNFSLFYQLKNNKSQLITIMFYITSALLIAAVFSYGVFMIKLYFQNQKLDELNKKIAVYGTSQQKASEKEVFDYKKKIDDFTALINNHRISSNVFSFIEAHTLSKVSFSSFTLSEDKRELDLAGESASWETLSNQMNVFENTKSYVQKATLSNSQLADQGKVKFSINLFLDPSIFIYKADTANPQDVTASPNLTPPTIDASLTPTQNATQ